MEYITQLQLLIVRVYHTSLLSTYKQTIKWANKHFIMTTDKQKAAVHFCEQWLNITFNGDINNFQQVSNFLSEYLEEAKNLYDEVKCEYEAYLWDLMD